MDQSGNEFHHHDDKRRLLKSNQRWLLNFEISTWEVVGSIDVGDGCIGQKLEIKAPILRFTHHIEVGTK